MKKLASEMDDYWANKKPVEKEPKAEKAKEEEKVAK